MKTIQVKAYEFDELSDSAKEKAREWWRSGNNDTDWSDCTIEEAKEQAAMMGINIEGRVLGISSDGKTQRNGSGVLYSGFWSQGDGACFEGTWRASDVKADKVADGWGEDPATTQIKRIAAVFAEIAKKYPHASFTVKHRGHYSHENCTEFEFNSGHEYCEPKDLEAFRDSADQTDDGLSDKMDDCFFQGTDDELKEAAKDFMRWIYRQLEKEYEYQNSDEQVDENIKCNEYLFSESGKRTVVLWRHRTTN